MNICDKSEIIMAVSNSSFFSALISNNIASVAEHLDNGLDVNANVLDGWTPILLAALFGYSELTKELIARGANVNSDRDGCTALMMACNCPNSTSPFAMYLDVIKQLVQKGANVKVMNREGMTALMIAVNNRNTPAIKYLAPLSGVSAIYNEGSTASFYTVDNNVVEIAICHPSVHEEIFSNLSRGERPTFFLDICSFLFRINSKAVIDILTDEDITLFEFLSISDEELKNLGVELPYQRSRILTELYKFHEYPLHEKSLFLDIRYSNNDMENELLSNIKQIIAMEAGLVYIMKNYADKDVLKADLNLMANKVHNMQKKIKLCKMIVTKLREETKKLDRQVKLVDLIAAYSRKYLLPWRKLIFSISVVSLILVFKIWK